MEQQRRDFINNGKSAEKLKATKIEGVKLSNELIEEIVIRLPPPSVAQFKCVSSQWRRRLSKPSFVERYRSLNIPLIGFSYSRSFESFVFTPIPSNIPQAQGNNNNNSSNNSSGWFLRTGQTFREIYNHALVVVSSSNGLLLLYYSSFLEKKKSTVEPFYTILDPITPLKINIPSIIFASYPYHTITKRFLVFGFAFDPYSVKPNFTIVEITSDAALLDRYVMVNKFSSPLAKWSSKCHSVPDWLPRRRGDQFLLSGSSVYFHGALHWIAEPSGIVSYDIRTENLNFRMNIPGDDNYVDENGSCRCINKLRDGGCYSSGECSCRYLGESRDQLVYVRATGDSDLSLWTLEDYYNGVWSHRRRIVIDGLPVSLFFGRTLAFDTADAHVLFLRVKKKVFSYNCITRELKEFCDINKDYGGMDNCLGFIVPNYLPRFKFPVLKYDGPPFDFPGTSICKSDPTPLKMDMIKQKVIRSHMKQKVIRRHLNNIGPALLYRHFGVSQVAVKFFPHLQHPRVDASEPPIRSSYDFYSPRPVTFINDAVLYYNDFIRIEACLYGSVGERE